MGAMGAMGPSGQPAPDDRDAPVESPPNDDITPPPAPARM